MRRGVMVLVAWILLAKAPAAVALSTVPCPPLTSRPEWRVSKAMDWITYWSPAAREGYAQYPIGRWYPKGTLLHEKDVDTMVRLLDGQRDNLAFTVAEEMVEGRKHDFFYAFWLERRPRFLNDEEVKAAIRRGEFDFLVPKFPVLGYDTLPGKRLGGRLPIEDGGEYSPVITTRMSKGGKEMDPMPIQFVARVIHPKMKGSDVLYQLNLDQLGNYGDPYDVKTSDRGYYSTALGTQFGHTAHRWSQDDMFLNLLMMDPDMKLLDAFMACTPSDFPGNELPTRENAGPVMLRMGLERLRSADPVLFDDSAMIHTDPFRPHGRFEGGIDRLRHLKDLWPLTYGFQAHRRALLAQYLNTQGAIWSWQGYIDGMTALRADTLEAIEAYAAQVEQRGMVFIPRLSREPYVTHAAGKEPPTWTLGPPK